jgi:hypothetical protein
MIKAISEEQGDTYEIGNRSWQDVCHGCTVGSAMLSNCPGIGTDDRKTIHS